MCGAFLSRNLVIHRVKGVTMNPNQMMMAKAMVAQQALREEANRSREAHRSDRRPEKARKQRPDTENHGVFDYFLGLALPGRR
jgi:hypothetical protein